MNNSTNKTSKAQKICFVVMGFGEKVDYVSGRTLDLDATFDAIIKPACEELNYKCIRADEIHHSGVIDLKMYKMLLEADLVIADISTSNPNAIYEVGVRHALKRKATILMKEDQCKFYFDLDHVSTITYEHLEKDIGNREVIRVKQQLKDKINSIDYDSEEPDSPVYTFLPNLKSPIVSDAEMSELIEEMEEDDALYFELKERPSVSLRDSRHSEAMNIVEALLEIRPDDEYLLQQLALHTYKSKTPDKQTALISASNIIRRLDPENSNNPETTGIAGAIFKRLFDESKNHDDIDKAIRYYQRGFILKKDYYNGENLADCYKIKSNALDLEEDKIFFTRLAQETSREVMSRVKEVLDSENFNERKDKRWVYATAASIYDYLDEEFEFKRFETLFLEEEPAQWEKDTFYENLRH
ncbi:tetratricopeptide repeat-containing protein [Psychrobacter immobilis]|uniref:tetratricopeptide repeat-containing protein n=1 Tax=Psychrobacter immobilis TaxID=498 RepID=UPI0019186E30|nr:tetratricopeptide repeat-containing protein [Psychrobacter immobilis]